MMGQLATSKPPDSESDSCRLPPSSNQDLSRFTRRVFYGMDDLIDEYGRSIPRPSAPPPASTRKRERSPSPPPGPVHADYYGAGAGSGAGAGTGMGVGPDMGAGGGSSRFIDRAPPTDRERDHDRDRSRSRDRRDSASRGVRPTAPQAARAMGVRPEPSRVPTRLGHAGASADDTRYSPRGAGASVGAGTGAGAGAGAGAGGGGRRGPPPVTGKAPSMRNESSHNISRSGGGRVLDVWPTRGALQGAPPEFPRAPIFSIWLENARRAGGVSHLTPVHKVVNEWAAERVRWACASADAFYKAHRGHEWFRARYDPVEMLRVRAEKAAAADEMATAFFAALDAGTLVKALPRVGGGFSGGNGRLGLALPRPERPADAPRSVDVELELAGQPPVLTLRGVPPFIPLSSILRVFDKSASHISRAVDGLDFGGRGATNTLKTRERDNDNDIAVAAAAAFKNLKAELTSSRGLHVRAAQGTAAKRAKTNDSSSAADSAEPPKEDDATASLVVRAHGVEIQFSEDAFVAAYRGRDPPKPIAYEASDPRRLPAIGYRRTMWFEYESVADAAVVKALIRCFTVEVAGPDDVLASTYELSRVQSLVTRLGPEMALKPDATAGASVDLPVAIAHDDQPKTPAALLESIASVPS